MQRFKWDRPTQLPCKFLLCNNRLTETIEGDFHQWDQRCFEQMVSAKTYVCLEHARMLQLAVNMNAEVWLSQEGWVYVVSQASRWDHGQNKQF